MAQPSASSSSGWTEPPWCGWIETTGDALLILEAARRGVIPRVTRRLVDSERKMISSGSVFVFDEDESGIKRWTDGLFWSPSRILGNFLLYRETDKRGAGHRRAEPQQQQQQQANTQVPPPQIQPQQSPPTVQPPTPAQSLPSPTGDAAGEDPDGQSLARPKGEASRLGIDRQRERVLVGSLTNSYKFKANGLMKKTFSLTISGVSQHLVSYYKIEDVESGRLRTPSSMPELAALDISPEYLDKTHFRNPPKVEIGLDGVPRYSGEADESDPATSPRLVPGTLQTTRLPLLTEVHPHPHAHHHQHGHTHGHPVSPESELGSPSSLKRTKRYDPYGPPPSAGGAGAGTGAGGGTGGGARRRPSKKLSGPSSPGGADDGASPTSESPVSPYGELGSPSSGGGGGAYGSYPPSYYPAYTLSSSDPHSHPGSAYAYHPPGSASSGGGGGSQSATSSPTTSYTHPPPSAYTSSYGPSSDHGPGGGSSGGGSSGGGGGGGWWWRWGRDGEPYDEQREPGRWRRREWIPVLSAVPGLPLAPPVRWIPADAAGECQPGLGRFFACPFACPPTCSWTWTWTWAQSWSRALRGRFAAS